VAPRGVPQRTCVGCRARAPKAALLRVVARDGAIAPDPSGSAPGRGAYLHREAACVERALARGTLTRALRTAGGHDELGRLRDVIEGVIGRA
jgi:predicted RNA-binding protein YlxR (DUF448 family)